MTSGTCSLPLFPQSCVSLDWTSRWNVSRPDDRTGEESAAIRKTRSHRLNNIINNNNNNINNNKSNNYNSPGRSLAVAWSCLELDMKHFIKKTCSIFFGSGSQQIFSHVVDVVVVAVVMVLVTQSINHLRLILLILLAKNCSSSSIVVIGGFSC